jgi:phospholipid/cholesterol/gamma-HCH transport system ATP-binding protein
VVSHDVPETLSIASYVHIISAGKVVESGSPDALRNSNSEWTRQFIQGDADGPVPFHFPAEPIMKDLYG